MHRLLTGQDVEIGQGLTPTLAKIAAVCAAPSRRFRAGRVWLFPMAVADRPAALKVVGSNGQISLGKHDAGRHVLVEEREPGVWIARTATVIPDNERWLHEGPAASDLDTAMAWSVRHESADAELESA